MILDIRKRLFIFGGIGLLLLLALLFGLYYRSKKSVSSGYTGQTATSTGAPIIEETELPLIVVNDTPAPPPVNSAEREKLYVVQLSKIFVERYMSYSNQGQNGNISDVVGLATSAMVKYIETQSGEFSRDYKGVSTKVISSSLQDFAKDKATVTIGIQQFIEEKGKSGVTAYKNGSVTLVKENGIWKVDGLYFEKKS